MIIREEESAYIFIEQHEHARLAGWLAALWGNDRIAAPPEPRQALILATTLHDIGWRPLDNHPIWDEASDRPYPFTAEPLIRKIPQYHAGIDMVEAEDPYAALLCSRHYTSFFPPAVAEKEGERVRQFVFAEEARQDRLRETLLNNGREAELLRAEFDLGMLKLWDHLSLYIALNRPGVAKEAEHPFYRDGFPPTYIAFEACSQQRLADRVQFMARWLNEKQVTLAPFALQTSLPYALSYRKVSRLAIVQMGFTSAYQTAEVLTQVFSFIPAQ